MRAHGITLRDSVPCLSNCIITAAARHLLLLLLLLLYKTFPQVRSFTESLWFYTHNCSDVNRRCHWSSDGQRMASLINVFSDILLITRHKGHYCIRVS